MRSLAFNLRDTQNPDLREHVLTGEIVPSSLVRMSAADLANKDLAEWRRKVEEEHNKAIELDVEAAAKVWRGAEWVWICVCFFGGMRGATGDCGCSSGRRGCVGTGSCLEEQHTQAMSAGQRRAQSAWAGCVLL